MNRNDIIRMAREAGFITGVTHASNGFHHPFVHPVVLASCLPELERFAALVAEHEREACAAIVEVEAMTYAEPTWALRIVDRIRARSQS